MKLSFLLCSSGILNWLWAIILGCIVVMFFIAFLILTPFRIWFKAFSSGARISVIKLIGFRERKLDLDKIVDNYILAKKGGLYINIEEIVSHMQAEGNVKNVIDALILARSTGVNLSFETAKSIDLSGRDVVNAVKNCINPKIIETHLISAVAQNGVEVKLKAILTVKTNMPELVGNPSEETIIARVEEGLISEIGSYQTQNDVLNNTNTISSMIFAQRFDEGCGLSIVSVDITQVEIGRDFNTQFKLDQVEIEKKKASAKAEERRLNAIAEEQEMKIKVQEMNIKKVEKEMEVPEALLKAVKEGKMNILDYYKMQNIIADTNMRKSFTGDLRNNNSNKIDRNDDEDEFEKRFKLRRNSDDDFD